VVKANAEFIRLRLRYDLSMAASGSKAAQTVLVQDDAQVAKAVTLLPQAAQLARAAAAARQK